VRVERFSVDTDADVVEYVASFYSDTDARSYTNGRPDQYPDLAAWSGTFGTLGRHAWIAYYHDWTDPVALVGLRDYGEPGTAELFITVARHHRGHGHGRELAWQGAQMGHVLGYHRIEARVDVENVAGLGCFQRAGYTFEGIQRALLHQRPTGTVRRDYALYATLMADA